MYFNAFRMNCVTHMSPGLWMREDDHMVDYVSLAHWTEFARLMERGCFDAIFLADVVGLYDVYGGNRDAALGNTTHLPINDPMLLLPAMAAATEHLGFGYTSSIMQYHPFTFARLISTLDPRPSDQGPGGLEHRDLVHEERGAQLRARQSAGA